MTSSETPASPPSSSLGAGAGLVEAASYSSAAEGSAHGLVVLSMGRPYWLVPSDAGFRLLVENNALDQAREELACYDRESLGWPPLAPAQRSARRKPEVATPFLWGAAVVAVFCAQTQWPGHWEGLGALDPQAIFEKGQWWRPATALFLHRDLAHLLSNLFSGILVFSAVLTTVGRGRGWLLLALSGVAGNAAAALLHRGDPYVSLGASTAVFAGVGILAGRAARLFFTADRRLGRRLRVEPVVAGLGLLALCGTGGLDVDVIAHGTGFAAGLIFGFLAGQ